MAATRAGRSGALPGGQTPRRMQQRNDRSSAGGDMAATTEARQRRAQTQARHGEGLLQSFDSARLGVSFASSLNVTPHLASLLPASSAAAGDTTLSDPMQDLAAHSTLQSQVKATQAWRRDLKALLDNAQERFADVCWVVGAGEEGEEGAVDTATGSSIGHGTINTNTMTIWAHKAVLYARATNMFQSRYLQLRDPISQLGALAASSTVSLPSIAFTASANTSQDFSDASSSIGKTKEKRKVVRGPVPPSSFQVSRLGQRVRSQQNMSRGSIGTSDSGISVDSNPRKLKAMRGRRSNAAPQIGYPLTRASRASYSPQVSQSSEIYSVQPSASQDRPSGDDHDDVLSVVSSQSTIQAPLRIRDVTPSFFQATLEYLYTAEESMVDIMEFLYEDRLSADNDVEERLERLRQDFVYMWRSRLYSDIEIIVGENDTIRSIPDALGSVFSLSLTEVSEEEQTASFSAHRMILASRSPYFAAQLLTPYSDQDTRVIRLPSPPFTPAAMHFTLGFLYTGTLFFSNRTFDLATAFQLWLASSYLQIETLQALVSSLIAQDFCHSFSCSPPCKSCVKRIPKTLAFVSRPDVSDVRLRALAEACISGEHFGSYWSKDVGNLSQGVRQAVVSKICDTVKEKPGFAVIALRQLAIVLSRVNVERSSRWVDSVRAMCESLHDTLCDTLVEHFGDIVKTEEWIDLVDGVGFNHDVLDKVLAMLVESLNEKYAAKLYEILVGEVLLCEDHMPPASAAATIEEARRKMIQYLTKRWVNVRSAGGFNGLQMWALKEIGAELDVPYQDLVLSDAEMSGLARAASRMPLLTSNRNINVLSSADMTMRRAKAPVPGMNAEGEREPGPIHLRASVLNRNAARVASGRADREDSRPPKAAPKLAPKTPPRTSSQDTGPRVTQFGTWSREDNASPSSLARVEKLSPRAPSNGSSPSRASVSEIRQLYEGRTGQSSSSQPTRPLQKSLGVASGSANPATASQAPQRATSQVATRPSDVSGPQASQASGSSVQAYRLRKASAASLQSQTRSRASSVASAKTQQSTSASQDGGRSQTARRSPTTSVSRPTKVPTAVRRQASATSLRSERSNKSLRQSAQSQLAAGPSSRARAQPSRIPSLPSMTSGKGPVRRKSDVRTTDAAPATALKGSTTLSLGIPCIAQPTDPKDGRQLQLRAIVKYIGPVINKAGQAEGLYIGLEVDASHAESAVPLLDGFELHDGTLRGQRYFSLGPPKRSAAPERALSPEREVRRGHIAKMLAMQDAAVPASATAKPFPSIKRRKEEPSTTTSDDATANLRGLFVRPQDIQTVLVS